MASVFGGHLADRRWTGRLGHSGKLDTLCCGAFILGSGSWRTEIIVRNTPYDSGLSLWAGGPFMSRDGLGPGSWAGGLSVTPDGLGLDGVSGIQNNIVDRTPIVKNEISDPTNYQASKGPGRRVRSQQSRRTSESGIMHVLFP